MERPPPLILDKIDRDILAILARDCRTSYSNISSQIGLTPKAVKARVKNMVQSGITKKFVVRINPAAFGYKMVTALIRTTNEITKDEVIQRVRKFGKLAHHVHQVGRTTVAALVINESCEDVDSYIQSLNDCIRPATVSNIVVSHVPVSVNPSETDLRIIKCLLQAGARVDISELAKQVGISEKTATRRLNRMKEGRLLDFSLQCDPAAMVGYVQYCILIIITSKSYTQSVYERMYSEFQKNILYHPSVTEPDDRLAFVLFGENTSQVDSVLAKVDSFGVKMADAFIVTKIQYYDDWVIREIDKRLSPTIMMPVERKSIKAANTLTE